ncbi:GNAT family N-acetyltransferase [Pontibacillus salicampi]|uniref:GNAT family N-acetyltransferase n=1 Tax=Pontibacillus salicampi TaxID=1449801 RepID=A0ABV6LIP7_9BACI
MLVIRNAEKSDVLSMLQIENYEIANGNATFDLDAKTLEEKETWFQSLHTRYPIIVAELDDYVVGYAYVSPFNPKQAYQQTVELSVYVDASYRGRKIGKSLMEYILEECENERFHTVISKITKGNEGSVRLHKQVGFQLTGTLKEVGFKFNTWQDVEIYQYFCK